LNVSDLLVSFQSEAKAFGHSFRQLQEQILVGMREKLGLI